METLRGVKKALEAAKGSRGLFGLFWKSRIGEELERDVKAATFDAVVGEEQEDSFQEGTIRGEEAS